jgi:hypothetical protein
MEEESGRNAFIPKDKRKLISTEVLKAARSLIMMFCSVTRVGIYVETNVSEKRILSIFSLKDGNSMFLRNVCHTPEAQYCQNRKGVF